MKAIVVLVVGLVVGIVVPFFWASPLPVFLGAALIALAGLLVKRLVPALVGIVAAILLVLTPGLINGYRDGQGVAWTVPEDENLMLAEGVLAVTSVDREPVLRGRDLRTGERRWELTLPERTGDAGNVRVWRAGATLLVAGFDDRLRGVDIASGRVRWEAPPADTRFVGVTDREHVALTRCPAPSECEVQSLSLEDGRVAWKAPTSNAEFLGVPLPDDGASQRDLRPWPASFVLVTDKRRYDVRDLVTGRVLATGNQRDGSTAILGDVLVRSTDEGALTATNAQTGAQLWSRPAGDGKASRSPVVTMDGLAVLEGQLLLTGSGDPTDGVRIGDRLRVLIIGTGKIRERPVDVDFDLADVLTSDQPTGKWPVVFWRDYDGDASATKVIAGDHEYARDNTRNVDVAPRLLGFGSEGHTWGTGLERVYEVFDRDSGERILRYAGEDVSVFARGDVLVLRDGDDDDAPQQVIVTP
ncbi:PQQ-binding-like beta-propeller repeat protein [Solirubrobacter taibaiensis]|nr:PQQ-binding-like beta-propeller repeat protein [Solirubrobacter taibaiensis]